MSVCRRGFVAAVAALLIAPAWFAAAAGERQYAGTDASLGIAFSYPDAWKAQEERGRLEPYRQVRLRGPRNQADTYTAYIIVRSRPSGDDEGSYESVEALMQRYRELLPEGTSVDQDDVRQLAGSAARDLIVSSTIPKRHRHVESPEIPVTTRTVCLEHGHRLYELVYSADAREYPRFVSVFERLLDTLEFR
jgi:hypothetical protein